MNKLFSHNFDEILQSVFLYLDPTSLKICRCVSREWNSFILHTVWKSRHGRRRLNTKLQHLWKHKVCNFRTLAITKDTVYSLDCDENFVFCGTLSGFIEAYHISSTELIHRLCCTDETSSTKNPVQFDVDFNIIAALTESGIISIWEKFNGIVEYKAQHHGPNVSVFGIKIAGDLVVTGASDGSIVVIQKDCNAAWHIKEVIEVNTEEITHIDVDNDWLITGTDSSLLVWNLERLKDGPNSNPIGAHSWIFNFHFPFIYVVGGELWSGLQVWNMQENRLIRHIQINKIHFHTISSNDRLVAVSEIKLLQPGASAENVGVYLFDIKQLCDDQLSDKELFRRHWSHLQTFEGGEVNAAINTSSMFVAHANSLGMRHFWQ